MVLQPQPPICITAGRVNPGTSVIIDGQIVKDLCDGQCVEVHPAAEPLRILPHPGRHHFDTLASKLQWGQSPHHSH
jgi:NAD kinase